MLENHQRAAQMLNEPDITWLHCILSRFAGRLPGAKNNVSLALIVQGITQQSGNHAELAGLVEHGAGGALPVVFAFVGTLDLETRDIAIEESGNEKLSYVGNVSKNGRVITLRSKTPQGAKRKPFHLVHEETLALLDPD